jgi:hypothetical protein
MVSTNTCQSSTQAVVTSMMSLFVESYYDYVLFIFVWSNRLTVYVLTFNIKHKRMTQKRKWMTKLRVRRQEDVAEFLAGRLAQHADLPVASAVHLHVGRGHALADIGQDLREHGEDVLGYLVLEDGGQAPELDEHRPSRRRRVPINDVLLWLRGVGVLEAVVRDCVLVHGHQELAEGLAHRLHPLALCGARGADALLQEDLDDLAPGCPDCRAMQP